MPYLLGQKASRYQTKQTKLIENIDICADLETERAIIVLLKATKKLKILATTLQFV
jgi:hypothetical protein